jgi:hypothetical protein
MSSMICNAGLNTTYHGPTNLFKDAMVDALSLTGIHNLIVKCLFIISRNCIHKDFQVLPQVKFQRIQIWQG